MDDPANPRAIHRTSAEPLGARQRAYLRSLAHKLKPIQHVGKEGLSDAALRAIEAAFDKHELLKIKVLASAPAEARECGDEITRRLAGVRLVQIIGRTIVLYRPHPEKPVIRLPRREADERTEV